MEISVVFQVETSWKTLICCFGVAKLHKRGFYIVRVTQHYNRYMMINGSINIHTHIHTPHTHTRWSLCS